MSKPPAKRFARILLATDGSPGSMQACEAAAQIARAFDSQVTILSAIPSIGALAAPLEGEYYSKIVNKADDNVDKAASVFRKAGVAVAEKEIPQGRASPVETIVEYAANEGFDLIVMGTRGMGGFKRAALGSVSSAVTSHAPCSTLVVRQAKATKETIRRILVAVDGSENAQRALEAAVDMAKRLKAVLLIAHVVFVPALSWTLGLPGVVVPADKIEDDAEKAGRQLLAKAVKFAKEAGIANPQEEILTKLASPAMGIVELAEKGDADLVVVGTKGLGGFKRLLIGSVANSVLHYAERSVLVVK
jgi:nucleotide-binding universal stress UspA family protein